MSLDFIMQFLTLYGPLGMGWILWWLERKASNQESSHREDLLRETIHNSTVAMTTLAERLQGAMNVNVIRRNDEN